MFEWIVSGPGHLNGWRSIDALIQISLTTVTVHSVRLPRSKGHTHTSSQYSHHIPIDVFLFLYCVHRLVFAAMLLLL